VLDDIVLQFQDVYEQLTALTKRIVRMERELRSTAAGGAARAR
jgi:hypothetical protein